MSDKVFLDTNILVYSYSVSDKDKQLTARKIIAETDSYVSTQVLTELTNTLTRKFKLLLMLHWKPSVNVAQITMCS